MKPPVLRITTKHGALGPIVDCAARLICTTPEYDDLAKEVDAASRRVLGKSGGDAASTIGATDPAERAKLGAELEGLIAHLYGLTEGEFAHILTTFPLVSQDTKDAALAAYRQFAPKSAEQQAALTITAGESATVEFKATARWNLKANRQDTEMERAIRDLFDATVARCRRELPKVYSKELIELIFRQPYCKISFVVDAGIAKRKTASEYLQELEGIGILAGEKRGREVVYKHPALIEVLTA